MLFFYARQGRDRPLVMFCVRTRGLPSLPYTGACTLETLNERRPSIHGMTCVPWWTSSIEKALSPSNVQTRETTFSQSHRVDPPRRAT